jgi:ABC-type transport system involved in multi-copper enzyme maturation permease subunit
VVIITFYLAASAGSTIAGGIEKRTIDFDLSQPISRVKYALSQFIVTLKYSAALVIFNVLIIYILCLAYNIDIKIIGLLAFGLTAIFLMWALTGIAAFLSSFLKSKISVVLVVVIVAFGSYVFFSLCNIIYKINDYKFISLYNYYHPQKLLESGRLEIKDLLILFAIFAVGTLASLAIFNKKDV